MRVILYGSSGWIAWFNSRLQSLSSCQVDTLEVTCLSDPNVDILDHAGIGDVLSVIVLDAPGAAVHRMVSENCTLSEALQREGNRLCFAAELSRASKRTIVAQCPPSDAVQWAETLLNSICEAIAVPLDVDSSSEMPPWPNPVSSDIESDRSADWVDTASPSSARCRYIESLYCDRLARFVMGGGELKVVWPREVFYHGAASPPPTVIDVAGGIRHLYFGPYLTLPAGDWTITASIGFGSNLGKMPFFVEVNAASIDVILAKGFFRSDNHGLYSVSLDVSLEQRMTPLEVRFVNLETALEGTMALIDVECVLKQPRLEPSPPDQG